ncbi:MAG: hypothetical protein Q7S87_03530 [Agitococcus sp.]|nr:hypothetical protein [Agitococcus sp.]MDO9177648.1 hypothetical protein [Agitococcus sp.]
MNLVSRVDMADWSDTQLYAYALLHGFGHKQQTRVEPQLQITYSYCFGVGYSDTKFWEIPFTLTQAGFPLFTEANKEVLIFLIAQEHLVTWRALKKAQTEHDTARDVHAQFIAK